MLSIQIRVQIILFFQSSFYIELSLGAAAKLSFNSCSILTRVSKAHVWTRENNNIQIGVGDFIVDLA